jgi:hypothetical protein
MSAAGLFAPFKAVGFVTDGNGFAVNRLGSETFIITSIGKSFQVRQTSLFKLVGHNDLLSFCFRFTGLISSLSVLFQGRLRARLVVFR